MFRLLVTLTAIIFSFSIKANETKLSNQEEIISVLKENSEAVVLVYSFDKSAPEDHRIFNSILEPRSKKHLYNVGVCNGIVLSEDGIIVVPFEGIKNSTEIFISINSELKNYNENTDFKITKNDYKAEILKEFPKRNLAFLKIKPSNKLSFIKLGNNAEVINNPEKVIKGTWGIIGKAKAERFFTLQEKTTNRNNFDVFFSYINGIEYRKYSGKPFLIARDLNSGSAFIPETCGGALLGLNGSLFGIICCNYKDFAIPTECAIPVEDIRDCVKLAGINLPYINYEIEDIGIEVTDLENPISYYGIGDSELKVLGINQKQNQILGVSISSITKGKIAESVGLLAKDIVIKIGNDLMVDKKTFDNVINRIVGKTVFKIIRDRKIIDIEL